VASNSLQLHAELLEFVRRIEGRISEAVTIISDLRFITERSHRIARLEDVLEVFDLVSVECFHAMARIDSEIEAVVARGREN
jgi:hypothetical protein